MAIFKLNTGKSIREILDENEGVGPGFHFIRYALALTIFAFHSYYVTKGQVGQIGYGDLLQSPGLSVPNTGTLRQNYQLSIIEILRPGLFALVAAFFAVSGFLVTGSAQRLRNVKIFLGFRLLRIFPALAVETLLSAFVLGPIVTVFSFSDYLQNPSLWRYLGNIVGWVSFTLPGVFIDNSVSRIVNVNLWTLPGEFYCYLIMTGLMLVGLVYTRRGWITIGILGTLLFSLLVLFAEFETRANTTHFTTAMIIYYFFIGCIFYVFSEKIPVRLSIFSVSVVAYYFLTLFHINDILASLFLSYCAIFVGCQFFPLFNKIFPGDYSYGIYLYGFPIQQTFAYIFPEVRNPVIVFFAAGLATLAFAVMSWILIEKPALKLKKWLVGSRPKAILPISSAAE